VGAAELHPRLGGAGKKLAEAARLWARGDLLSAEEHERRAQENSEHLDADAAGLGFTVVWADDPAAQPAAPATFYLWPENLPAWEFFQQGCGTQWRYGQAGPTGLDYCAVDLLMRRRHIPLRKRARLLLLVQAMEHGALQGWRELADERERKNGYKK
jgi:hypothetical protein